MPPWSYCKARSSDSATSAIRHQEFLKFLRCLDKEFPGKIPLHLVLDNYGTHTHANVKAWLKRHPRFVVHKVPTSSSWLNLIERWYGELTTKRIRRGVFLSVPDLIAAIDEFLRCAAGNGYWRCGATQCKQPH